MRWKALEFLDKLESTENEHMDLNLETVHPLYRKYPILEMT